MKSFNVRCMYEDRKQGPTSRVLKIQAGTIAGAIGRASREFVSWLDRKQRFDAGRGGLTIVATRNVDPNEEQ